MIRRVLLWLVVVVVAAFALVAIRAGVRAVWDGHGVDGRVPWGTDGTADTSTDGGAAAGAAVDGAGGCDHVVPSQQGEVDAAAPGEVVCLEAGVRGPLRLVGLRGTDDAPVTVVNLGGVVDIRGDGAYAGIEVRDAAHLRITGSGVARRCGARHAESAQDCGIRVTDAHNGVTGKVRTHHLVVDHLEVGDVANVGVGVYDSDRSREEWLQRDVAFRDLYLHDIGTEGHYHGSSDYRGGEAHLLDGVEIVRNLVVRTGRDGVQVGSAPWNCRIADNVVADTGLDGDDTHAFGIVVNRGAACDVTGNRIERVPRSGIYDQGLHGQVIADNTIVDVGEVGIDVRAGDQSPTNPDTPDFPRSTRVERNRVADAGAAGIHLGNLAGVDNRVQGNEVTGGSGAAVDLADGVIAATD